MLRDRRKSLTLDHHKSPPLERLKGERRGSFAAPSCGPSTPPPHPPAGSQHLHPSSAEHHPYKHERRGSLFWQVPWAVAGYTDEDVASKTLGLKVLASAEGVCEGGCRLH
ncbi:hypothetical protein J6590_060514 [Homalodisca vitripennis]|nr:hypothetical protein J6590_060514 [Homalodisca vitripennis]